MKFADASTRLGWMDYMAERCRSDVVHYEHFKAARQEFTATLAYFQNRPIKKGDLALRDRSYVQRMEKAVRLGDGGGYYYPEFPATDSALCEIPNDFASAF
jgi:hypothetical protein